MATVKDLNEAIGTLKDECLKHDLCCECPLRMCNICGNNIPFDWVEIKRGDSDG